MTGAQLRAARTVLGLGVHELAARLRMGNSTIVKLEGGGLATARASTVHALRSFYEAQGVSFVNEPGRTGVKWRTEP
jgi:transcriptional regulator with XRE-family HTH domain